MLPGSEQQHELIYPYLFQHTHWKMEYIMQASFNYMITKRLNLYKRQIAHPVPKYLIKRYCLSNSHISNMKIFGLGIINSINKCYIKMDHYKLN